MNQYKRVYLQLTNSEFNGFRNFDEIEKSKFCFKKYVANNLQPIQKKKVKAKEKEVPIDVNQIPNEEKDEERVLVVFVLYVPNDRTRVVEFKQQFSNQKKSSSGRLYYIHPYKKRSEFEFSIKLYIDNDTRSYKVRTVYERGVADVKPTGRKRKRRKKEENGGSELEPHLIDEMMFEKFKIWWPFLDSLERNPNIRREDLLNLQKGFPLEQFLKRYTPNQINFQQLTSTQNSPIQHYQEIRPNLESNFTRHLPHKNLQGFQMMTENDSGTIRIKRKIPKRKVDHRFALNFSGNKNEDHRGKYDIMDQTEDESVLQTKFTVKVPDNFETFDGRQFINSKNDVMKDCPPFNIPFHPPNSCNENTGKENRNERITKQSDFMEEDSFVIPLNSPQENDGTHDFHTENIDELEKTFDDFEFFEDSNASDPKSNFMQEFNFNEFRESMKPNGEEFNFNEIRENNKLKDDDEMKDDDVFKEFGDFSINKIGNNRIIENFVTISRF